MLPSIAVAVQPHSIPLNSLCQRLISGEYPVIARIHHDCLLLDMRTVRDDELSILSQALTDALTDKEHMNNHVIIGFCRPCDHGKTCLIRALTGTDTDRLEEEKRRGITIDLGFTYLSLPDGGQAASLTYQGMKSLCTTCSPAPVVSIWRCWWSPPMRGDAPNREHLGILSLLGIRRGCVAVTKIDMVEQDWLDMMLEELRRS